MDKFISLLLLRPSIFQKRPLIGILLKNDYEEPDRFERRFGVNGLTIMVIVFTHAHTQIFEILHYIQTFPVPNYFGDLNTLLATLVAFRLSCIYSSRLF